MPSVWTLVGSRIRVGDLELAEGKSEKMGREKCNRQSFGCHVTTVGQ